MCLEGDYRYPLGIDTSCLVGVDCLLMSSNVIVPEMVDFNLNKPIEQRIQYSTQIFQLLSRLNEILNSSPNAKVLMPVQPTFLLELVDLLLHKLNDQVQIVVISYSAYSVVQYANINLEYLNRKLQEKIYLTENPLSFDKLFKQNRLKIYSNI